MESEARQSFKNSLQVTAGDSTSPAVSRLTATEEAAQRLQKVLAELGSPESVKYAAKESIVDDDDSWMEMTPGQLDQLLQAYQAQTVAAAATADGDVGGEIGADDDVSLARDTPAGDDEDNVQRGLQDLVSKMGSFVKGTSGLEGVEGGLGDDPALGGEGEVDFDSDVFVQALQQMLSTFGQEQRAAEDDSEGEEEDEDGADEEDEDVMGLSNTTERGETQPNKAGTGSHRQAMREAMDEQLEEELRNTHVQSGFEKVCLSGVGVVFVCLCVYM